MREEAFATLIEVLEDPERGRRQLPKLVGMLDADDPHVRTGAAWAVCHVAREVPDTVAYLARRLGDRLEADDPAPELALTFAFVAHHHPEAVAEELEAMDAEAADRRSVTAIEGTLARANYPLPGPGDRDVGRTRFPSGDAPRASQGVYTRRNPDDERTEDADGSEDAEGTTTATEEGQTQEPAESTDAPAEPARGGPRWEPADELPTVVYQSRFDQLTVLARVGEDRYADVYRTLGVIDDEELAVAFNIYRLPAEGQEAFALALEDRLDQWATVDDHDHVVTLHDHGASPRPWSAAEFTDERLLDREQLPPELALWNARRLVSGLQHIHEQGVVHGGIDPRNVVYLGNVLEDEERHPPLLTNVALMEAIRAHFDPTDRLDPRYAAPEYYDRQYGRIDHSTDVYHIGAVLYRLFTGRHPYEGPYNRVREAVLSDPSPRPSHAVEVPDGVDEVVTKAMARDKLRRYETVSNLASDLRSIEVDSDG